MSMPDDTAYRSRVYNEILERGRETAEWIADKAEEIANFTQSMWRAGEWSAKFKPNDSSLDEIVSEALCSVQGNTLYDVLELVRLFAHSGNLKAAEIMERICQEYARTVAERMYERRGL